MLFESNSYSVIGCGKCSCVCGKRWREAKKQSRYCKGVGSGSKSCQYIVSQVSVQCHLSVSILLV
jgi:hypothetical protein